MKRYKNLNGNSSVIAYEISPAYIDVLFEDKSLYRYNYLVTGIAHVEQMKLLAQQGKGLCTYINKFVRKKYSNKLKHANVSLT